MKKILFFMISSVVCMFNAMYSGASLTSLYYISSAEASVDRELKELNGKTFFNVLLTSYSNSISEHQEIIKDLIKKISIDRGAAFDVHYQNDQGLTALHVAVYFRDVKVVSWLVNFRGADCQRLDSNGYSPLVMALQSLARASKRLQKKDLPPEKLIKFAKIEKDYERILTIFKNSQFLDQKRPFKIIMGEIRNEGTKIKSCSKKIQT